MSVSYSTVASSGPKRPAPLPPTSPLADASSPMGAWDDPPPLGATNKGMDYSSNAEREAYAAHGFTPRRDHSLIECAPEDESVNQPLTKRLNASFDDSDDDDDYENKRQRPMYVKVARKLLLIFNFLIMLGGLALFCSVALHEIGVTPPLPVWLPPHTSQAFPAIIMVSGALIVVCSFIGWVAALKELQCCIGMFLLIVSLSLVFVLGGGIISLSYRNQFFNRINIEKTLEFGYGLKSHKVLTFSWDIVQEMVGCCGVRGEGSDAWQLYGFMGTDHLAQSSCPYGDTESYNSVPRARLPRSCCEYDRGAPINETYRSCVLCIYEDLDDRRGTRGRFTKGCSDKVDEVFSQHRTAIILSVTAAVIGLFIGLVLASILCNDSLRAGSHARS